MKDRGEVNKILQLGTMWQPIAFDLNAESLGLNRKPNEGLLSYVKRVIADPVFTETNCLGLQEMAPCKYNDINSKLETHECTYYFALASGNRMK